MPSNRVTSPHAPARPRRVAAGIAAVAVVVLGVSTIYPSVSASAAQAPVNLRTAAAFAVLAGSGITNTGPTTITGDVGTFPTPAETGFGTVTLHGTDHGG